MTDVDVLRMPRAGQSLAFIAGDGAVWLVFLPEPWDLASWLWWILTPKWKKSWIQNSLRGRYDHPRAGGHALANSRPHRTAREKDNK